MSRLLREVARQLRYQDLPHLVGKTIEFRSIETIGQDAWGGVSTYFSPDIKPKFQPSRFHEIALAKYGLLDLKFDVSVELDQAGQTGMALLEELGLIGREPTDDCGWDEILRDSFVADGALLKLLLRGPKPSESGLEAVGAVGLPDGYLPRPFELVDACLTNSDMAWFSKHFYL